MANAITLKGVYHGLLRLTEPAAGGSWSEAETVVMQVLWRQSPNISEGVVVALSKQETWQEATSCRGRKVQELRFAPL